jgi:hypothetical protein
MGPPILFQAFGHRIDEMGQNSRLSMGGMDRIYPGVQILFLTILGWSHALGSFEHFAETARVRKATFVSDHVQLGIRRGEQSSGFLHLDAALHGLG